MTDIVAERIAKEHGQVAFDIGANVGRYTRMLAANFAKVYAFEPDPRNLSALLTDTASLPNVEVIPMAVSNKTGACTLLLSDFQEASSLSEAILTLPGLQWSIVDRKELPCITIDEFCSIYKVQHVDFIKMDIESAEAFVWEGAHDTLTKGVRILMEVHRTVDAEKLGRMFASYGYTCQVKALPRTEPQWYLTPSGTVKK